MHELHSCNMKHIIDFFRNEEFKFSGITNVPNFAKSIQKSFANQTVTLAKTMDEEAEQ